MRTFRFHYFIKQLPGTSLTPQIHCIRVSDGDKRISELTKLYYPIGWNLFIQYPYQPSEKEEIWQLKQRMQHWDNEFIIESIDDVEDYITRDTKVSGRAPSCELR